MPFGFGDGMGDTGSPARDILYYATLHEHPLVGGSIGRKPPDAAAAYSKIPILDTLLRFASGSAASAIANGTSGPSASGESSAALPCRYVVIDRATASSESVDYLQRTLPLALLAADSGREVVPCRPTGVICRPEARRSVPSAHGPAQFRGGGTPVGKRLSLGRANHLVRHL